MLDEANDSTGGSWRLDARFTRGVQGGAWRIRDGASVAVLKWHDPASNVPYNVDAPAIVEYLRRAGYPTPEWLASGVTGDGRHWSIQELVDGEPLSDLDLGSAEIFVELVDLQRTLTPPTAATWNSYVRGHAFGAPQSLAAASGDVGRLLTAALDLSRPYESTVLVDTEMVHSDLSVTNILVRDGQLAAVVDIDATGRGCAVYDLLSPAVNGVSWNSDPRAVDRLVQHGLDTYGPGPVAIATTCLLVEHTTSEQRAARHLSWLHDLHRRLP